MVVSLKVKHFSVTCSWALVADVSRKNCTTGLFKWVICSKRSVMVDLKGMHLSGHVRLQINYYIIISCNVLVM